MERAERQRLVADIDNLETIEGKVLADDQPVPDDETGLVTPPERGRHESPAITPSLIFDFDKLDEDDELNEDDCDSDSAGSQGLSFVVGERRRRGAEGPGGDRQQGYRPQRRWSQSG